MEDDDSELCRFGTPLKQYEEDEIPSKRPVSVEDQIVRDANGKRRFHGAFTGGFSAGFWNTVGSLEGWKPSEFKSSRTEKAESRQQKPTDFMDDEDLGEFGIAPQRVKTMDDFSDDSSRKRKYEKPSVGPIPGVPVLQSLLAPSRDKVAVRILKKMGWKDGQGVGARLTRNEKKRARERNAKEMYVMKKYGCDMGPFAKPESSQMDDEDSDSDLSDYEITFAPDDFDPFVITVKDNTFGLGYSGLNRDPVLKQSFNLFDTLEIVDRKTNKKLSIRGQAFGVGALEEDDEDIYSKDDMSRYDFSLDDSKQKSSVKAIKSSTEKGVIEGFRKLGQNQKMFKKVFKVQVPENFKPRNWMVKRSRFEPLAPEKAQKLEDENFYKKQGLGRHDLTPSERGKLLNDAIPVPSSSKTESSVLEKIAQKSNSFTKGEVINLNEAVQKENSGDSIISKEVEKENSEIRAKAEKITKDIQSPGVFRPFATDPDKQSRYEQFRDFKATGEQTAEEFLRSIQPFHMSEWDRELEKKEFLHAKRLYKPLVGLMSDRFVTEGTIDVQKTLEKPTSGSKIEIKMKRTKVMWKPHKDLCKRFNVPEPFAGLMVEEKPKKKSGFSVFDYIECPTNTKTNFVTPVVIPKHVPVTKKADKREAPRMSAKQFFNEEEKVKVPKMFDQNNEPSPTSTNSTNIETIKIPEIISKPTFSAPKTELEQKVEESRNKRPEEKKDLFKSIFCDSSDEENEENVEQTTSSDPNQKQISEQEKLKLVESFVATKPASEFNILRNQSPPRGIFKNMFEASSNSSLTATSQDDSKPGSSKKRSRSPSNSSDSSSDSDASDKEVSTYGPMLPTNFSSNKNASTSLNEEPCSSKLDEKLSNLLKKSKSKIIVEEWVEKGKSSKKKKKKEKHKKSKKHKHTKKKKDKK